MGLLDHRIIQASLERSLIGDLCYRYFYAKMFLSETVSWKATEYSGLGFSPSPLSENRHGLCFIHLPCLQFPLKIESFVWGKFISCAFSSWNPAVTVFLVLDCQHWPNRATGDPYKCFQPGFWPCGVDWERGALRLKWSIFWNEVLLGCVGMELAQASSRVFALKLCAWRTCQSTHSLFWVCVGFTIVVSRLQLGSVPVGRIIILALWLWR